jgi:hypothetical protein
MKLEIWLWIQEYEDGNHNVNLYHSEGAARGAVQSYVLDQWNEGNMDGHEMPGDLNDAVQMYYEQYDGSEWYNIHREWVDLPAPPQDKDTVDLNGEEVQVVVAALENANIAQIAEAAGMLLKQAEKAVDTAYIKLKD